MAKIPLFLVDWQDTDPIICKVMLEWSAARLPYCAVRAPTTYSNLEGHKFAECVIYCYLTLQMDTAKTLRRFKGDAALCIVAHLRANHHLERCQKSARWQLKGRRHS